MDELTAYYTPTGAQLGMAGDDWTSDRDKVEVDAIRAMGGSGGTGFVPVDMGLPAPRSALPVRN